MNYNVFMLAAFDKAFVTHLGVPDSTAAMKLLRDWKNSG
jgi:hypothetical protein